VPRGLMADSNLRRQKQILASRRAGIENGLPPVSVIRTPVPANEWSDDGPRRACPRERSGDAALRFGHQCPRRNRGLGLTGDGDVHAFLTTPSSGSDTGLLSSAAQDRTSPMLLSEDARKVLQQWLRYTGLGGRFMGRR
jgi:hypothetical protein